MCLRGDWIQPQMVNSDWSKLITCLILRACHKSNHWGMKESWLCTFQGSENLLWRYVPFFHWTQIQLPSHQVQACGQTNMLRMAEPGDRENLGIWHYHWSPTLTDPGVPYSCSSCYGRAYTYGSYIETSVIWSWSHPYWWLDPNQFIPHTNISSL